MSVESDIQTALTSGSPSPTIAGDRVFKDRRPQDQPVPAIVYTRISNEPVADYEGDAGVDRPLYQIDCWAETTDEARTLLEQARAALRVGGFAPYMSTDRDEVEEETRLFRSSADFELIVHV